tara:strand:- start:1941 stop:3842 length:1902 start_codon:yes stop_codon:yes gene_type:complete
MKLLKDLNKEDLDGKCIIIRVGMDVPIENGKIIDDTRVKAALDSINHCTDNGAKVILLNHVGRPENENDKVKLSNKIISEKLSELLDKNVMFSNLSEAEEKIKLMDNADILVLENVRFDKFEIENNNTFAKSLATFGELYVNDAFSVSHRKQASVHQIMKHIPSYAGILLEKEIEYMNKLVKSKEHPFVVILGGKKITDKIPVIENLIGVADYILIGGAMAYTFLKAKEEDVQNSIVDNESLGIAKNILEKAEASNTKIILPVDSVYNDEKAGCDIGPETLENFKEILKDAKLIFWNGPLGISEDTNFAKGTEFIAKMISDSTATTVIGGGETLAAIKKMGLVDVYTHVSTGGGASMEFISGKNLPGIAALEGVFETDETSAKRRIMIAGNWKMNKTIDESIKFADKFNKNIKNLNSNADVLVCGPYTCLHSLIEMFKDSSVMVGAENMHWEDSGAFTGEISGQMLKDIGCTHVILGHSERRQYFNELNKTVNQKIKAALKNDLTPVVCVGETLTQREDDKTKDVIENQIERCLVDITADDMKKLIIAYEPIWAIGTGQTATPEQAQRVHAYIRSLIKDKYGAEIASGVRILYGGSMKPENAAELTAQIDVDGGLVGGAALDPDSFAKIVEAV